MQYHNKRKIFYTAMKAAMKHKPPKAKSLLLSQAIEGFMLSCRARRLSENTISDYSHTLKVFLKHVGDEELREITPTQARAFLAAQPHSEKTVLNYHITLSALWTWAVKEEFVTEHIMRKVERPKPKTTVIETLSETQMRAMLGSLGRNTGDRDRAVLLLLVDTGIRASELCSLQRKSIDLVNRQIKLLGKGNKERLIPFSPRTASAIFKHLSTLENGDDVQAFNFDRNTLRKHLGRIGKRAGVAGVHPHRFRHTFSITYLRNGGDPYTLQEILGHSTMEMVKHYLKLAEMDLQNSHRRASPVENWKL